MRVLSIAKELFDIEGHIVSLQMEAKTRKDDLIRACLEDGRTDLLTINRRRLILEIERSEEIIQERIAKVR